MADKTGSSSPWQPMLGADPDRLRLLGELLRLRRAAIGFRHVPAFTAKRGLNTRMVGDIEHGRRDTYTFPSLEDVAAAYEVTCESMTAVVWSGAAELVPAQAVPRGLAPAGPDPASSPIADPGRRDSDRPFFDEINEQRVRLAAGGVTDPDGGQMFGEGTDDARAWDGVGDRMSTGDKVWFIADLRRRASGRAAGSEANDRGA